jgi:hypothetical protein
MNIRRVESRQLVWSVAASVTLMLAGVSAHGQSIGSVSGSPSHGASVVISGSSFGTKPTAAPIKWDDFERGTDGTPVKVSDGWSSVDGWDGSSHSHPPYYSTAGKHAGNLGVTFPFVDGTYNSSMLRYGDFANGFYIDFWYRYQPATPNASRNNKIFLVYGTNSDYPQVHFAGHCDLGGSILFDMRASTAGGSVDYTGMNQNNVIGGELRHVQVWMDPSDPGAANGVIWAALDGRVISDRNDMRSYIAGGGTWNSVRVGYYVAHDGIADCPASGDAYAFWDNIYIDNTQARVELGNNAVYSACTYREIQVPTDWSSSQITVNVNQGNFQAGDTPYLFVVTAAGAVSPGHQVVIGGTAPTGPGQPGKPVF